MADHIVKSYDAELRQLDSSIAEMGRVAERMLASASSVIGEPDARTAEAVIASDKELDALQLGIEEQAIEMIARRQPVAEDLRRIISALRIAGELERVGDLSKNIAKRTLAIGPALYPVALASGLRLMAAQAGRQLTNVLASAVRRDAELALDVWRSDATVDRMYNSLFREMLTYMMEDQRNIGACTHLLFVAKNIERIGDHTTNIAENVHFLVTGSVIDSPRPKGDTTSSTLIDPQS